MSSYHPSIANIIASAMAHDPRGNEVFFIFTTVTGGDPDLAQSGTEVSTERAAQYEPYIAPIPTEMVRRNEATFRWSDEIISVAKDDLSSVEANDKNLGIKINGEKYKILKLRPSPSSWDFIVRKPD